jgi:hypothetical protein
MDDVRLKHRQRTWLRGHLPHRLSWAAPKGKECGAHEWYRQDDKTWACYHCEATTAEEPFSPAESVELRLAALRGVLVRAGYAPLSTEDRATIIRLATETETAAHRLREKLEGSPEQVIAAETRTAVHA